ncbi:DEAD box ATP-dependent RNA helicase, partial [Spraguea lophii 42_110]
MSLFSSLPISTKTLESLSFHNYTVMTTTQSKVLPSLLNKESLIINTSTGSGKTLCFVISSIEYIYKSSISDKNGTVVVITPTRELAYQIFDVYGKILKYHNLSVSVITGGSDKKLEEKNLKKGCNILVCTPGRLLDHLNNYDKTDNEVKNKCINPKVVIIDEVDKMFEIGFKREITSILSYFKQEQIILCSATLNEYVIDFGKKISNDKMLLQKESDKNDGLKIIECLDKPNITSYFSILPEERKIDFLFSILKKKTIVFFSSCNEVNFYYEIFKFMNFNVYMLHGKLKQNKRTNVYNKFNKKSDKSENQILFCTDVGARGLDFEGVERIIHYGLPVDENEYKHRIGRTGRNGKEGKSIMILTNSEKEYANNINKYVDSCSELKITKIKNFGPKLIKLVKNSFTLN